MGSAFNSLRLAHQVHHRHVVGLVLAVFAATAVASGLLFAAGFGIISASAISAFVIGPAVIVVTDLRKAFRMLLAIASALSAMAPGTLLALDRVLWLPGALRAIPPAKPYQPLFLAVTCLL